MKPDSDHDCTSECTFAKSYVGSKCPWITHSATDAHRFTYSTDSHMLCPKWGYGVPVPFQNEMGMWTKCYSQILRVATYNIWNLNSLELETYENRLQRLGKVRLQSINTLNNF